MDAFDHQYLIALQLQLLAAGLTLACLEIVAWQLHFLATQQGIHLVVEQRDIEGVQVLEVIVAIGITRCEVTVEEIVVEGDADRIDAIDGQLYGESLAGGGLATAGGACYQHYLDAAAAGYLVGNLADLLLLQGLADLYESRGIALDNGFVQVADGA